MKRIFLLGFLALAQAHAGSVTLSGTGATEGNSNGWAMRIPDLKASSPGVYVPIEVAPKNPFSIGTITWSDASVPATGAFNLPVTNSMCVWTFANYSQDVITQLAAVGTGGANIVLSSITGTGLTFKNRVLETINFTANVSWTPTFNGFPSSQPYFGTLTFVDGVFTWNLSGNTANWFIGASDVHFEFDLIGTVAPLARPVLPTMTLTRSGSDLSLGLSYAIPSSATFRLESNDTLTGTWTPIGSLFTSATVPQSTTLSTLGIRRRFYRVERVSP